MPKKIEQYIWLQEWTDSIKNFSDIVKWWKKALQKSKKYTAETQQGTGAIKRVRGPGGHFAGLGEVKEEIKNIILREAYREIGGPSNIPVTIPTGVTPEHPATMGLPGGPGAPSSPEGVPAEHPVWNIFPGGEMPTAPEGGGMGMAGMMQGIKKAAIAALEMVNAVLDDFTELAGSVGFQLTGVMQSVNEIFSKESFQDPIQMFKSIMDVIKETYKFFLKSAGIKKLFGLLDTLTNLINNPAFRLFNDILGGMGDVIEAILSPLEPLLDIFGILGDFFKAALAPVFKEIGKNLAPIITKLFNKLSEIEIDPAIIEGIGNAMIDLGEALVNIDFGTIINKMAGAFIKFINKGLIPAMEHLPDVLDLATRMMILLFSEGWFERIFKMVEKIFGFIIDNWSTISQFVNILMDLLKGFVNFVESAGGLKGMLERGIGAGIGSVLGGPLGGLVGWFGKDILGGIEDLLTALMGGMPVKQHGGFVSKEVEPSILHGPEFVFTPEQTRALGEMGMGGDELKFQLQDNNKLLKKLIKIEEKRERRERFR